MGCDALSLAGGLGITMVGDCDHRTCANLLTHKGRIRRSISGTKGRLSGRPEFLEECADADEIHHPLHVVRKHLQTHLTLGRVLVRKCV